MALARGIRNNNPLNIRKGNNWQGERHPQADPAFEEFQSMEMGLRAGFVLLRNYIERPRAGQQKCNTVRKIISRWAPTSENNTAAYIKSVCAWTGLFPDETIKFSDRNKMIALAQAMARVECGALLSIDTIASAYDLV